MIAFFNHWLAKPLIFWSFGDYLVFLLGAIGLYLLVRRIFE